MTANGVTTTTQICTDGTTEVTTTYQNNTDGSLDGTVLEVCQPAVATGTNAGDVSCLTSATSVTVVTKTSTAGAYASTTTNGAVDPAVITQTCDAMTSTTYDGTSTNYRRCVDTTDTTSEISVFDSAVGVAGETGALTWICGATYDEVTLADGGDTTTTGNYACRSETGDLITKWSSAHVKTWDCTTAGADGLTAYACTSETTTAGKINDYWGTYDQPIVENYTSVTDAVVETLASTCLSDGTNTWCDLVGGTATITLDTDDSSLFTCTAVATSDSSQTCTDAGDANHTIKYMTTGAFTETFEGTSGTIGTANPYGEIVCAAPNTTLNTQACTLTAGCDQDAGTPDASFEIDTTDGSFTIDLTANGNGGCVLASTAYGGATYSGAIMTMLGNDKNGTWA